MYLVSHSFPYLSLIRVSSFGDFTPKWRFQGAGGALNSMAIRPLKSGDFEELWRSGDFYLKSGDFTPILVYIIIWKI